jgi:hypothetical protein
MTSLVALKVIALPSSQDFGSVPVMRWLRCTPSHPESAHQLPELLHQPLKPLATLLETMVFFRRKAKKGRWDSRNTINPSAAGEPQPAKLWRTQQMFG